MKEHHYRTSLKWTGNADGGTTAYDAYSRDHEIAGAGKTDVIAGSSDAAFRGDGSRYNPEEMLVASLSACHMLWYLHLCAVAGVVVTHYEDEAAGTMTEDREGGRFTSVTLCPEVTVTPESDREKALHLHEEAARLCYIARSVTFPVSHRPRIK